MNITRTRSIDWAIVSAEFAVSAASFFSLAYGLPALWLSVGVSVIAIPIAVGVLLPYTLTRIPVAGILGVNSMIVVFFVGQMITDGTFAMAPLMAYVLFLVGAITLVCACAAYALYAASYWLRSTSQPPPWPPRPAP